MCREEDKCWHFYHPPRIKYVKRGMKVRALYVTYRIVCAGDFKWTKFGAKRELIRTMKENGIEAVNLG